MPNPTISLLILGTTLATTSLLGCNEDRVASSDAKLEAPQNADTARDEIRRCFDGYMMSVLDLDGDAAVDLVTQSTADEYARLSQLALNARKEEVENLRLTDYLTVILLRETFSPAEIRMFSDDGRAAFAAAVRKGMISVDSVTSMALGEIQILHTAASGVVVHNGAPTDLKYEFRLEENGWKLNLIPMMQIGNIAMEQVLKDSGLSDEEFMLFMITQVTGKQADASVFVPASDRP